MTSTTASARTRRPPLLAGPLLRTQPEERLAKLAGEGSKPAFDEIVRRHRPALVAFAARMAPSERADDVVQDSMVKAYLALGRGDRPDNTKAWLFKIVRNTALNDQRDWRVHEHLDENYDGVEQPPEAAEKRRQLKELVVALGDLPETQRQAIVQRELEGRGHDEIATDLKITPGAVRQLIFRARGTLRAGLGALVPIQLLRLVAMAGADPASAGAGAAAGGLGLTAAKVGLGAVLATGAIVAGSEVEKNVDKQQNASDPVATQASGSQTTSAAAIRGRSNAALRRQQIAARQKAKRQITTVKPRPVPPQQTRALRPPPPNGGQRGSGPHQGGTGGQQGTEGGGSGTHQGAPPPGGTGTGSGSGTQPPPSP